MDLVAAIRKVVPPGAGLRWRRVGGLTALTLKLEEAGAFDLPLIPYVILATASDRGGRLTVGAHQETVVGSGAVCALSARTAARYSWCAPHRLRLLFVDPSVLRMSVPCGVARDDVARHMSAALDLVVAEHKHPSQAVTALALVRALDGRFTRVGGEASTNADRLGPTALRRIALFVEQNLDQEITIELLARIVGFSRAHFARQFRASTGQTPMTYVTRARVTRAKELLSSGAGGATVAVAVGFCDQSHFNRVFKREVGVTPGAFVRSSSGRSGPRREARSP